MTLKLKRKTDRIAAYLREHSSTMLIILLLFFCFCPSNKMRNNIFYLAAVPLTLFNLQLLPWKSLFKNKLFVLIWSLLFYLAIRSQFPASGEADTDEFKDSLGEFGLKLGVIKEELERVERAIDQAGDYRPGK